MDKSTIKWILIIAAIIVIPKLLLSVWKENKREEMLYESINNGTNGIVKELKYKAQQSKYEERMQQLYHKGYTDGYRHGDRSEDLKEWEWGERQGKKENESDAYTYWTLNCEDSELEDETLFQEYRRGWYAGIQKRKESGH